jgi:hypothetical protein
MKNLRRAIAIATLLSFGSLSAACFGGFNLTRKLWVFNDGVSPSKFVKWLLFLGLVIVPIYEISALVDMLVLNSVEFWTGKNPVTANEVREDTRQAEGRTVHTIMTADHLRIEISEPGKDLRLVEISVDEAGAIARDGYGTLISRLSARADGSVVVSDGDGRELFRRSCEEGLQIVSAVMGGSPFTAVFDSQEHGRRLALAH